MKKKDQKEQPYYIERLRELMKKNKVTQEKLGKIIDKTRPTVASYLDGRTHIDVKTLQELADYFEVPITYFFEEKAGQALRDDYSMAPPATATAQPPAYPMPRQQAPSGNSINDQALAATLGQQQATNQSSAVTAMEKTISTLNVLVMEKDRVIRMLEEQLAEAKAKRKGRK